MSWSTIALKECALDGARTCGEALRLNTYGYKFATETADVFTANLVSHRSPYCSLQYCKAENLGPLLVLSVLSASDNLKDKWVPY